MAAALTRGRTGDLVRHVGEALLAIVNEPNVPDSEQIAAAQYMPSSFPGSPPERVAERVSFAGSLA